MIGRNITPSRRDAIRALAAISTGLPTLAYAAPAKVASKSADTCAWDAAMAHYKAIKAEADHFHATVWDRAVKAAADICPPYRFSHTAKNGDTVHYSLWPDDFAKFEPDVVDMWTYIRPQINEAQAKYAAFQDSPLSTELKRANEQSDRYGEALSAAEEALLCLPAPDLAGIAWKLRHIHDVSIDCVIEPGVIAGVLFDVRRLNGEDVA